MNLTKEKQKHYFLFAAILLLVGAASVAYGSTQTAAGYKNAGFVLLFIGVATMLFLKLSKVTKRSK